MSLRGTENEARDRYGWYDNGNLFLGLHFMS